MPRKIVMKITAPLFMSNDKFQRAHKFFFGYETNVNKNCTRFIQMEHRYCPAIPTDLRHGCLCVTFLTTKQLLTTCHACLTVVLVHYSHKQVCTYLATYNFLYNPSCCMKLIYWPNANRNRYKSIYKILIISNLDCKVILKTKTWILSKKMKWNKCTVGFTQHIVTTCLSNKQLNDVGGGFWLVEVLHAEQTNQLLLLVRHKPIRRLCVRLHLSEQQNKFSTVPHPHESAEFWHSPRRKLYYIWDVPHNLCITNKISANFHMLYVISKV